MTQLLKTAVLLEGITHLEDLSLKEFIRTVETLKDKIVTEKLDGANLWFGLDENGVFTSREGKSPKKSRFYDVGDYAMVAAYNGFRAAHLALEAVEPSIKKYFQPGDTAEIEVLFGRQPNTVTYGVGDKNFIVILRAVNDTPDERVQNLANALRNKVVNVKSTVVSSPDGENLQQEDVDMKWEFTRVAPMDTKQVDTKEAMKLLSELKKYLKQKNEALEGMTNEQVAELSLTSVPKPQREEAKQERERVNAYIMTEFKGPIKELLLNNFVRKVKPFLQAQDLDPSEDIGVEGVVVRDPVSGAQTKIVDKDVFTAINVFNTAVRNNISGLVRTADQDAPVEARGGVFGQAKIRIAELLGAKELAVSSSAKRFITKFKQADAVSTAEALADSLNVTSLPSVRTKTSAVLKNALQEINGILDEFKQEAGEFKLQLKTGKEIGISPEIMKRTLTAFAETKADVNKVNQAVLKSRTPAELVLALYGRTIESLFSGGENEVKESFNLIRSLQEEGDGGGAPAAGGDAGASSGGIEAQLTNPAGHPSTTQTSAIAPFPYKLLKGAKIIQRRKRNFSKPKKFAVPQALVPMFKSTDGNRGKFSLIKSVNEEWAHVKDMKFATDVDDSATAQADVEFKQLRNNVNMSDNVSQMDVNRYLDKAHELNDEVDSVTFGMETDDGNIVKVWVNAQEADAFEAALAELLGQEDDVEEVINIMADKFDIVDVEWPQGMEPGAEETPADDSFGDDMDADDLEMDDFGSSEEPPASDEVTSDEETPPEGEEDIFLGTESDSDEDASNEETPPEDEDETPPEGGEEVSPEGDEETPEDEDETPPEGDADEEDSSEEETEFDELTGEEKPKKKKSKEKKEESAMSTFGQRFKEKLLAEEKLKKDKKPEANKKKDDEQQEDPAVVAARSKIEKQTAELMKTFPTAHQKAIITLMLTLGAPVTAMKIHKAELRDNIEPAAEKYRKNSSFRMWANKLMAAIAAHESSMNEEAILEDERFERQLSNKYQRVIYYILQALGLPETIEATAARALKSGIRAKAALAMDDNDTRVYLMSVADQLGIDDKIRNEPEPNKNVKEGVVMEDAADDAMALVSDLLGTLGFETNRNTSLMTQARQGDSRKALMKLAANPTLMRRLNVVIDMIKDKVKTGQPASLVAAPQMSSFQKTGTVIAEGDKPVKWVIASMASNGIMITGHGMKIKLKGEEAEKLSIGLSTNKKVAVKSSDGTRFVFTPHKKGFIIKDLGDSPKYPDGLQMTNLDADEIVNMLSDE
jgi:hypothetical protein